LCLHGQVQKDKNFILKSSSSVDLELL